MYQEWRNRRLFIKPNLVDGTLARDEQPVAGDERPELALAELGEILGLADDLLEVCEDEVFGVALQVGRAGRLRVEVEVDAVIARDALADVVAAATPKFLHLEVARQTEEALDILGRQVHCNRQKLMLSPINIPNKGVQSRDLSVYMAPVGPLSTLAPELQASQAGKNSKKFPAFFLFSGESCLASLELRHI